jgi:hypothetical protein
VKLTRRLTGYSSSSGPENVKVHENVTSNLEINLNSGAVHVIDLQAAVTITIVGLNKGVSLTLILLNSFTYNPTWDTDRLVTEGDADFTYADAADKSIILEFLSIIDGATYIGLQSASDIRAYVDDELVDDPSFDDTADWTESANMSVTGGQLVLAAATSETTVEAAPFSAVAGALYQIKTVIDEVTVAGGGVKVNVGSADGSVHTTVGIHYDIVTAVDTDGLEIIAAGAAMTAKLDSVSVKRLI